VKSRKAARAFIACAACIAVVACASAPERPGRTARSFGAPDLIDELSVFLPESSHPGAAVSGRAAFTRDESLFLTADQIRGILPVLTTLSQSADISDSHWREARKTVEAFLTDDQKKELAAFQKALAQQTRGNSMGGTPPSGGPGGFDGGGPGGQSPSGGGPGDGGQAGTGGAGPGGDGPNGAQVQKMLSELIDTLQQRIEEITG
jgi:hypothetical protein